MSVKSQIQKIIAAPGKKLQGALSPKTPVHVFHHIPKCGGTSLLRILDSWFILVRDYRPYNQTDYPKPININRLRSAHCLCSHFDSNDYHIAQRYPGIIASPDFRLITFLRDPLEVKLSLYRFENRNITNVIIKQGV